MIFNLSLVTFVSYLTWLSNMDIIQAAKDSDLYVYYSPGKSTESASEIESDIQSTNTSSGISLGSKRPAAEPSTTIGNIRLLKYRSNTRPIAPEIDDNMENFLRGVEQNLERKSKEKLYYWEDYAEFTQNKIKFLCKNTFVSLKPRLNFKTPVTDDMKPDCDGKFTLGPSNHTENVKKYLGFFQYLPNLEGKTFFADLMRCNCAYLEWKKSSKRYGSVYHTLYYFYILKVTKELYGVLTRYEDNRSRTLKIVAINNICKIPDKKV